MPDDPTAIEVAEIYDAMVIGALEQWLIDNGYDGLISEENGGDERCGCRCGIDFGVCGQSYDEIRGCIAAHRLDCEISECCEGCPEPRWQMFEGKRPDQFPDAGNMIGKRPDHLRDATKKVQED